jgi:hypothetical protein
MKYLLRIFAKFSGCENNKKPVIQVIDGVPKPTLVFNKPG